ncbi:MAG TPA: SRPBCC family protein [Prosthecobacter sp.]|nr:SRPBCC family protein [Prosthecobacter sp.]
MIRQILLALAILVAILAVVIAIQPDDMTVTRSATMAAPPTAAFDQVNDFHKWDSWSPWAKLDPNSKITFEGPPSGTGSIFKWSGNSEVGEGQQTIVESRPGELVRIKLEFIKPFPGTSEVLFTFKPEGSGTLVTWTMNGKKNFIMKGMGLVMDCDKMMGGYFEKGLSSMKAQVEGAPRA